MTVDLGWGCLTTLPRPHSGPVTLKNLVGSTDFIQTLVTKNMNFVIRVYVFPCLRFTRRLNCKRITCVTSLIVGPILVRVGESSEESGWEVSLVVILSVRI